MPDILSQLGGAPPPDTSMGPLGAFPGASSPGGGGLSPGGSPEGSGGFLGGLGDVLGTAGQSLEAATPMILASVIGEQFGPEALGNFMAGLAQGQIARAKLQMEQQRMGMDQQRIDYEGERIALEREEMGERREEREAAGLAKETDRQTKVVEDTIETYLGQIQNAVEQGDARTADDLRKTAKGFLEGVLKQNPAAAARYSPDEISIRMPETVIQSAYRRQAESAWEKFYQNHEDYYIQLNATGGPKAVEADLANAPPFQLSPDDDPIPALEMAKKYGMLGRGVEGDLTVRLPTDEADVAMVEQDVAGAPEGTRQTVAVRKPRATDIPEGGVLPIGGQRTPRPPQPPISLTMPDFITRETAGGGKERIPTDPLTGQPKAGATPVQTAPDKPPPIPELGDYIRYRMAHPEYKGKFQQFVQDVEGRQIRIK